MKLNVVKNRSRFWVILSAFLVITAFLGGSSRQDVVQAAFLRPLIPLFLFPVLFIVSRDNLRKAPLLLISMFVLVSWIAIQLIPLPPSMFQSLTNRRILTEIDTVLLVDQHWRPISMAPSRGWNALFGVLVPFFGLLLAVVSGARSKLLLLLMASVGLLNAMIGFLQVLGERSGPLYFYSITSRGSAVGLFANENHSSAFSCVTLLALTWLFLAARRSEVPTWLRYLFAPAFVFVFLSTLISGSRGGLALAVVAAMVSVFAIGIGNLRPQPAVPQNTLLRWRERYPVLIAAILFSIVVSLIVAFIGLGRSSAFEEILARETFQDLRWRLWPVLSEMMSEHWLVGTGFGSFEEVYHLYEPTDLLLPRYINQAHNDWAQLVIEGGLPAVLMLLVLVAWIGA
ncbi:MAG: O-antigen ligase family protein, partial [Sphingomonadaceae bacterium]